MLKIKNYFKTILKHFFALQILLVICSFSTVFAQSTFNSQRLENAIISYVRSVNKCESVVVINQKIPEQRFTQSGVQATINHQGDLTGLCKVNIDFIQNGEIIRSQEVRIKVNLFATVPVATRFIPRGAEITAKDVENRRADVTNIDPNTVVELNEAIGKKSKSGIAKGGVIKYSDLIANDDVLIKRGDRVRLLHYSGAFLIRTNGFAMENGTAGSIIKVKRDNQTLYGFVADDGNIIIEDRKVFEQ